MKRLHSLPVIGLLIGSFAPAIALAGSQPQLPSDGVASSATRAIARSVSLAPATDWRVDINRYARRMIHAGFFPGMQIAVTQGDKVMYVGSFGVADIDSGRRVDDHTRFYTASTTKALTATAVVLEASRDKLRLDAPVTRYVPGIAFQAPLQADAVTIQGLLSMTDGIDDCLPMVFRTAFSGVFTQTGLIQLSQHCGPSKTGHSFNYRNLPYNLLGIVLAPDVRDGWKAVVRRDVLQPLGMSETTAEISILDTTQVAMPHEATGDGFKRIRLAKTDNNLHAAGGYFTTAGDLAKFIAVHAADGQLDGHRIFAAAVIASTHAEHASQDHDFGPYHRFGWGFGWDLGTFEGHTLVHRFGAFAGYRSHASFMPDTGVGVVVLANGVAVPFAADEMANFIYDRLSGDRTHVNTKHKLAFQQLELRKAHFAQRIAEHQAELRTRDQQALPHPLAAYTGQYVNPLLGAMNWKVSDGHLEVSIGAAQSDATISDAAKNKLRVELIGNGQVVRFQFPETAGPASTAEYEGYRFERVDADATSTGWSDAKTRTR